MEQKFTVVAKDPTNNNEQFTCTFFANNREGVEAEANLLYGNKARLAGAFPVDFVGTTFDK